MLYTGQDLPTGEGLAARGEAWGKQMQPQRESRLPRLLRNWLSQAGIVLGGLCFLTGVILLAVDFQTRHSSPYFGLLV